MYLDYTACPELSVLLHPRRHVTDRSVLSASCVQFTKQQEEQTVGERRGKGRQDRTGQDRTGQDRTGQDRTGQDRTGQDRTGQDRTGQDRTGQDDTNRVEFSAAAMLEE